MMWFGTYAGVFGYNGSDFTIINDETLGFDRAIAPLHIRSILEDSKGRLWIGNNGIGVLLKEGDSIINFSEEKNLIHPSSGRKGDKSMPGTLEHVFTIAEDRNGNIWFGGTWGMYKYDDSQNWSAPTHYNALIRKVTTGEDSLIFHGAFAAKENENNTDLFTSFDDYGMTFIPSDGVH